VGDDEVVYELYTSACGAAACRAQKGCVCAFSFRATTARPLPRLRSPARFPPRECAAVHPTPAAASPSPCPPLSSAPSMAELIGEVVAAAVAVIAVALDAGYGLKPSLPGVI